jgi:hypothetical protein
MFIIRCGRGRTREMRLDIWQRFKVRVKGGDNFWTLRAYVKVVDEWMAWAWWLRAGLKGAVWKRFS